ncbi:MAG: AbrB/MazE/SpoVT family DNA-binding domain-containing protein [Candidatus Omnitrophota bacterium]
MTIAMTNKNQVTIPKKLVTLMGLKEGALFNIEIKGSRLELIPLEVTEKFFTDEEYAGLERLYQKEKHSAKKLSLKNIEAL